MFALDKGRIDLVWLRLHPLPYYLSLYGLIIYINISIFLLYKDKKKRCYPVTI